MAGANKHWMLAGVAALLTMGCPGGGSGDAGARDAADAEASRSDGAPPAADATSVDASARDDVVELPADATAAPDALTAQVLVLHMIRHFDPPPYSSVSVVVTRPRVPPVDYCGVPSRVGACDVYRCGASTRDAGSIIDPLEYLPGGRFLVQGLSTDPLTLTALRTGPESASLSSPPYVGRVVTVTTTGDPEGMPPFRVSAPAPSLITLRAPAIERIAVPDAPVAVTAIRASRTTPLDLNWTGGGDDPVSVTLIAGAASPLAPGPRTLLRCTYAGAAGRATLTAEQLRNVWDAPHVLISVETGGTHNFAVGSNIARLTLTHYAASARLVFP